MTVQIRLYKFLINYLFGYDIFISYARKDASVYAEDLAIALQKQQYKCYIDKWGTKPGKSLPSELKTKLARSSMLVILATDEALNSPSIKEEVEYYLSKNGANIVPVNFGPLENATWFDKIHGLPSASESKEQLALGPSELVVRRIVQSCIFQKAIIRQRNATWGTAFVLMILVCLIFFSFRSLSKSKQSAKSLQNVQKSLTYQNRAIQARSDSLQQLSIHNQLKSDSVNVLLKKRQDSLQGLQQQLTKMNTSLINAEKELTTAQNKVTRVNKELYASRNMLKEELILAECKFHMDNFNLANAFDNAKKADAMEQKMGSDHARSDLYISQAANLGIPKIFDIQLDIEEIALVDSLIVCIEKKESGKNSLITLSPEGKKLRGIQGNFSGLYASSGGDYFFTTLFIENKLFLLQLDKFLNQKEKIEIQPISPAYKTLLLDNDTMQYSHVQAKINYYSSPKYLTIQGIFSAERNGDFMITYKKYFYCIDLSSKKEVKLHYIPVDTTCFDINADYPFSIDKIIPTSSGNILIEGLTEVILYNVATDSVRIIASNLNCKNSVYIPFSINDIATNENADRIILFGRNEGVIIYADNNDSLKWYKFMMPQGHLLSTGFIDSTKFYIAMENSPITIYDLKQLIGYNTATWPTIFANKMIDLNLLICYKSRSNIEENGINSIDKIRLVLKDNLLFTSNFPNTVTSGDYEHAHNKITAIVIDSSDGHCASYLLDNFSGYINTSCFDFNMKTKKMTAGSRTGKVLLWDLSEQLPQQDSLFKVYSKEEWIHWPKINPDSTDIAFYKSDTSKTIIFKLCPFDQSRVLAATFIDQKPYPSYHVDVLDLLTHTIIASDTMAIDGQIDFSKDSRTIAIIPSEGSLINIHNLTVPYPTLEKKKLIIPGVYFREVLLADNSEWIYTCFGTTVRMLNVKAPDIYCDYKFEDRIEHLAISTDGTSLYVYTSNLIRKLYTPLAVHQFLPRYN